MKRELSFVSIFLISISLVSCQSNPARPDAPICTALVDDLSVFECTDSTGVYRLDTIEVIGTSLDGYDKLQTYIEQIEQQNSRLRRRCGLPE